MSAASFKDIGNKHLQAGEFDQAIDNYTKAIELDGSNHVFYSNRSAAYLSKGDANSALNDGLKCTEVNPTWPKGYSRHGAALHALKRYDEALGVYENGLKIAPTDAGLVSGRAEVTKAKDSAAKAGGPGGLGGLFGPQMLAKLAGHPKFGPKMKDPAFMTKINMMQSNPQMMMQDPEMMEILQVIIGDMGKGDTTTPAAAPAPAQAWQDNTTASSSKVEEVSDDEDDMDIEDVNSMTAEEQAAAAEAKAEKLKQQQVERERKANVAKAVKAKENGNNFYKAKQFSEALAAFDEAIALDPTNMMFLNNKAAVFIEQGEYDVAIATCLEALEIGKVNRAAYEDRSKVHQRMATAHTKKGDLKKAIECYGNALLEHPDKNVERKMKNMELDMKKKAKEAYINPELAVEAKERGNEKFRASDFPGAITEYEDAVKRHPTHAPYRNNLAAALQKVLDFNGAKAQVEKALELDDKYVKAWAKKGDIEFFLKEYHKAMDSYKAGLSLEPDNASCKQGLTKTMQKVQASQGQEADQERAAHAMADPEIQMILQDPAIRQVRLCCDRCVVSTCL